MALIDPNANIHDIRNRLLHRLPPDELSRLIDRMDEQELPFKQVLYEQDGRVNALYFPNSGVISMVTALSDGEVIESGTVGYEGVSGVPSALTDAPSPTRVICQIPGRALRLPVEVLREEQKRPDSALLKVINVYLNVLVAMLSQTAACNRTHTVEERMARWLLMTHDRVESDDFPLTQEFLGQMLGVQRPTVNLAGSTLQRAGFIRYTRGRITVNDRQGLETVSCECYAHLRKLLEASFA